MLNGVDALARMPNNVLEADSGWGIVTQPSPSTKITLVHREEDSRAHGRCLG